MPTTAEETTLTNMKNKIFAVLSVIALVALVAYAQSRSRNSVFGDEYVPSNYNYGNNPAVNPGAILTGTTATGSQVIYLRAGTITLPDGRVISPYATTAAIIVGAGTANAETVTPSAVSGCYINAAPGVCAVTATFSNTHGAGELIASGTGGFQEAVNDASLNGGGAVQFHNTELVTLATGTTTTDTSANVLPANSLLFGVTGVVNTTITGSCTGWELGDATTAARFTGNDTTLTAGEKKVASTQLTTAVASATAGMFQTSAAKIRITCAGGNASAGKIRVSVWGYTLVAPAN
jgi:hypothetical protein